MPDFPDVPTFAEVGYPNVHASNDFGIAIRADTPAPIKAKLEQAYRTAVRRPEVVKQLADIGLIVSGTFAHKDLVEIIELPNHPWFVASQFHPEFKSRPTRPAPLFRDFVGAAVAFRASQPAESPASTSTTAAA